MADYIAFYLYPCWIVICINFVGIANGLGLRNADGTYVSQTMEGTLVISLISAALIVLAHIPELRSWRAKERSRPRTF